MGNKKKEIVEKYLSRKYLSQNQIECNIEMVLDKLHFEYHGSIGLCDLFSRPDFFQRHSHEFVSVHNQAYPDRAYPTKEFLVKGSCSDFDVLEVDLKAIDDILNENWLSRKIREKSKGLMFAPFALYMVCLGVAGYDRYIDSTVVHKAADYLIKLTKMDTSPQASGIIAGITLGLGGSIFVDGAAHLINKHYASKLSDEAESYDYGKDAENSLGREFLFEKAKSGEIAKQDFLSHFDKV